MYSEDVIDSCQWDACKVSWSAEPSINAKLYTTCSTYLHGTKTGCEGCWKWSIIRWGKPESEELSSSFNLRPILKRTSIVKQCVVVAELEIAWFEKHPQMEPRIIEQSVEQIKCLHLRHTRTQTHAESSRLRVCMYRGRIEGAACSSGVQIHNTTDAPVT